MTVAFAASVSLVALAQGSSRAKPLEDSTIIAVYSGPDHDAQLLLSTGNKTPMRDIRVTAPNGRLVVQAAFPNRLGQSDIRLDTPEPSLAKLKRAYPPGTYQWRGHDLGGHRLVGSSRLVYRFLTPPTITAPTAGQSVPSSGAVMRWNAVSGATRIHLEIEYVPTHQLLTIDLAGSATSFIVPDGFLNSGHEYTLDIKAVGAGGNLTVADRTFVIA